MMKSSLTSELKKKACDIILQIFISKNLTERGLSVSNYEKMIQLFEEVKDKFSTQDLQYVLELIQEYDSCRGAQEADGIEQTIINFCTTKRETNTQKC